MIGASDPGEAGGVRRQRRRHRATGEPANRPAAPAGAVPAAPAGAAPPAAATVEGDTTGRAAAGTTSSRGDAARGRRDNTERQWRELAGAGHTQLSRSVTIRVRDALRPSAEEITEAEATVEIRRRNWTPPPASG